MGGARQPDWVRVDHAGLVISPAPKLRDYGWWVFLVGLAVVWNVVICAALGTEGPRATVLCMSLGVPFLWLLVVGIGHSLASRTVVRVAADGVSLTTRFLGLWPRVRRLPLREVTVTPWHQDGSKGWTNTGVVLHHEPSGLDHRVLFPGSSGPRERARAMAELAWVAETLERATAAARAAPEAAPDDPALRARLEALLLRS